MYYHVIELWQVKGAIVCTVFIQTDLMDRFGQTVKTQIKLL